MRRTACSRSRSCSCTHSCCCRSCPTSQPAPGNRNSSSRPTPRCTFARRRVGWTSRSDHWCLPPHYPRRRPCHPFRSRQRAPLPYPQRSIHHLQVRRHLPSHHRSRSRLRFPSRRQHHSRRRLHRPHLPRRSHRPPGRCRPSQNVRQKALFPLCRPGLRCVPLFQWSPRNFPRHRRRRKRSASGTRRRSKEEKPESSRFLSSPHPLFGREHSLLRGT